MTVKLVRMLFGSCDYHVTGDDCQKAADVLSRSGANFRGMKICGGELHFTVELRDCAAMEHIFAENGISFECVGEHGLPRIFRKYRRRIGIPIGIIMFFFIIFISEKFIWSFEVVGNENIPSEVILERLDELGCGLGTYIPSVDFDELHMAYLLEYEDTAWISVNVRGTHASVEVLETKLPETVTDEKHPHNLVAAEEAVIYSVEIHRGVPMVEVGDLVKKGDLLASGLIDIKSGFLLAHARGTVKGTVEREIHIEVPLETTRMEPTGREFGEKYLNIFGISVKFFGNTENLSENHDKIRYDKTERKSKLSFFGDIEVPIETTETVYIEYAETPVVYTEDEARTEAYRRFSENLRSITSEGEIITRETDARMADGVFIIDCRLTLVCNIAIEQPIYTDNTQEK